MKRSFRKYRLITFLLSIVVVTASAQDTEYNMEVGILGGGCFYMGDANTSQIFLNTDKAIGILARYNLNPRMVLKSDLAYGRLLGSTERASTTFPDRQTANFNRSIYEWSTQFEYNFFAYGSEAGYKDSHRLTPYIQAGIGLTFSPKPVDNVLAMNLPIGIGIKYKIAPRINIGAEWSFRFTTSDKLDVSNVEGIILSDPYNITSKGLKNKDSYSFAIAYISYDIFAKKCDCND